MLQKDLQRKNPVQFQASGNGAAPFVGQPCLVVGMGGIGHRVVLALKAQLVAIFGGVPSGIRLLVFDIDDENLSVRVGDRPIALEREAEFFCLGPVPVARIKRNLDNLPTIRDRLPCLQDLPSIAAARAAKQLRPIGQLAFQWQFPRIHALMRDLLWTLAGRDQRGDENLLVDPSQGLKIIQVGSNCGGTNAGMFIDLGYLIRSELEGLGTLGDACTIIGIGMLPGAFRGIEGPNLVPNTVASLMELESAMVDGNLSLTYRDGTVVEPARSPFDMYLLVDAVDEGGRVWVSRDELCRMVARAILVLAATRLGEQGEGELDNLDEVLSQRTTDGHGTFFGSLGLAVLEFPAETIVELFTARHAHEVIAKGLLRPADIERAEADALAWLQAQGLSADALLAELARDEAELPLAVVLEPPASLRHLPDHQVPQEAIQFVQAYTRLRLDGDYRACVHHNAERLIDHATLALEGQVWAVVNDPRLGLAHGQALLRALCQRLSELQSALILRREGVKVEESQQEGEVSDAIRELIQATEVAWPFRHRRVTGALDRYLQVSRAFLAARLDGLMLEQAVAVVATLAEHGRELGHRLATLKVRLEAAAAQLAQEAQGHARRLGRRRGSPALVLVDEPYLERLYRDHVPDLGVTLAAVLASAGEDTLAQGSKDGLMGWSSLGPEALADMVRRASQGPFEPIRAMTIEDVVAARGEFSPQARLAALLDEARPAWNLDETRLPGGDASLKRITALGVPDRTRSIFQGNGDQLVSIYDPHTIMALSLTIGAPYTALQAWPDYLAEYERVRHIRPLHTLPAFQVGGEEAKLALALGLIFGQIYTHGVHFYYRPADELAPDVRLAQGAANAIQSLAAQEGLVREVMDRIEAHIEHIGIGRALEELTAYCTPAPRDDDLARELKRLVRDYAEMLQANARIAGGQA